MTTLKPSKNKQNNKNTHPDLGNQEYKWTLKKHKKRQAKKTENRPGRLFTIELEASMREKHYY